MAQEIDYNELFGVDTGANDADPAGPQDAEASQGENGQTIAGSDVTQYTDGVAPDGAETTETAGEAAEIAEQPEEERAKYAAARRKAELERDAAIAKARQEADRAVEDVFRGMNNPYTGKPITSRAEFDEYRRQFDAQKKEQILKKSGMTAEAFDNFISELPEVRSAKEQAGQAERAAREAAAKVKLDEQMKEIAALDPSVKDMADLAKMPAYPRFYELVKKGNSFVDAYKLANLDTITQRTAAAAKQAAINSAQGKAHLTPTNTRGTGSVAVPADERAMYLALNPKATDDEIARHYNSYINKK